MRVGKLSHRENKINNGEKSVKTFINVFIGHTIILFC
jgi:hypothetical protein